MFVVYSVSFVVLRLVFKYIIAFVVFNFRIVTFLGAVKFVASETCYEAVQIRAHKFFTLNKILYLKRYNIVLPNL